MNLTNNEIYMYYNNLEHSFVHETRQMPAKIYFYILKNQKTLEKLVQEIEQGKMYIIDKYHIQFSGDGQLLASREDEQSANKELQELSNIQQDVNIYMLKLQDIEELEFTPQQMEALMFMIEE